MQEKNWQILAEVQYLFVGDFATATRSFLMTIFDNAVHGTPQDNYNFFHLLHVFGWNVFFVKLT